MVVYDEIHYLRDKERGVVWEESIVMMPKSVRIERATDMASSRTTRTAYIALGSNMGDRVAEIEEACNQMDKRGLRVKRTSSLWFKNDVAEERKAGRKRL